MPGFIDTVIVEVRDLFLEMLAYVRQLTETLPSTVRNLTTYLAVVLLGFAVIGIAIIAISMLLGMIFVYPRRATLSNRTAWDDYMDNTFLPHFLVLKKQFDSDLQELQRRGAASFVPNLDLAAFPQGDADCVTFVKNFFKCHSAYDSNISLFGKPVFELPDEAADRIDKATWLRVQNLRQQLRAAAAGQKRDSLWMPQAAYASETRGPLHASMRNAGASYDQYIAVAQMIARSSAVALELDLLFNTYLPDIVQRYDSRHRKIWGNNYIVYYFMKDTTISTSNSMLEIWSNWGKDVVAIAQTLEKFWRSLGDYVYELPMYLIRSTLK
jgi:hypothetical protein